MGNIEVEMPDKRITIAKLSGDVNLTVCSDDGLRGEIKMTNVLYVPDMNVNLWSTTAAQREGYRTLFTEFGGCKIWFHKTWKPIYECKSHWRLYLMNVVHVERADSKVIESCNTTLTSKIVDVTTWHKRFGHIGIDKIKDMIRNGMIPGVVDIPEDMIFSCDICSMNKTGRGAHTKKAETATKPLGRVFSDILDLNSTPSFQGYKWQVTFVDEYSRMAFIYPMKYKSEVLDKFKEFKLEATTSVKKDKIKYCIERLRSDNGSEFTSGDFQRECKTDRIIQEFSSTYTPQQNGKVERHNQTFGNRVRCLLAEAGLSPHYWVEAAAIHTYLYNRTISSALKNKTPYELFTGIKPDVSHLRIFGSVCFCLIHNRTKLQPPRDRCIFLGYHPNAKMYRVQNIITRKIRYVGYGDVRFQEERRMDTKALDEAPGEGLFDYLFDFDLGSGEGAGSDNSDPGLNEVINADAGAGTGADEVVLDDVDVVIDDSDEVDDNGVQSLRESNELDSTSPIIEQTTEQNVDIISNNNDNAVIDDDVIEEQVQIQQQQPSVEAIELNNNNSRPQRTRVATQKYSPPLQAPKTKPTIKGGHTEWHVDEIIGHRMVDDVMKYKIKWNGNYAPTEEPEWNLTGCKKLLNKYKRKNGLIKEKIHHLNINDNRQQTARSEEMNVIWEKQNDEIERETETKLTEYSNAVKQLQTNLMNDYKQLQNLKLERHSINNVKVNKKNIRTAIEDATRSQVNGFTHHKPPAQIPKSYQEALESPDADMWIQAMETEYSQIMAHETWSLTKLPPGQKAVGSKWVFDIKSDGRYKARLVAMGYTQHPGLDFQATFSPVLNHRSFRILMSIACELDLETLHLDISNAFLNGKLQKPLYMSQPVGFVEDDSLVCKLFKSLYGLKQAGREWNYVIHDFFILIGLKQSDIDRCLYYRKHSDGSFMYVGLYVDDIGGVGSQAALTWLTSQIMNKFKATNKGAVETFLGMQIVRDRKNKTLIIHQDDYCKEILQRFGFVEGKSSPTPMTNVALTESDCPTTDQEKLKMKDVPYREITGCLMYLMVCTRPDIATAVISVSKFNENPGQVHWTAVKRILRYLAGTTNVGITFRQNKNKNENKFYYTDENKNKNLNNNSMILSGYVDASYADQEYARSTCGYVTMMNNGMISWKSKGLNHIATSTTEAEYMAQAIMAKEVMYVRNLLNSIDYEQVDPTLVFGDNEAALKLAAKENISDLSKHFNVRYHYIRDCIRKGTIELAHVESHNNIADVMTKPITAIDKFTRFKLSMGMISVDDLPILNNIMNDLVNDNILIDKDYNNERFIRKKINSWKTKSIPISEYLKTEQEYLRDAYSRNYLQDDMALEYSYNTKIDDMMLDELTDDIYVMVDMTNKNELKNVQNPIFATLPTEATNNKGKPADGEKNGKTPWSSSAVNRT